jgi:hypothetical protein
MSEIISRLSELSQRVDDLKVPPHSLEAEQSVIGGLMLDNRSWDDVADIVVNRTFIVTTTASFCAPSVRLPPMATPTMW